MAERKTKKQKVAQPPERPSRRQVLAHGFNSCVPPAQLKMQGGEVVCLDGTPADIQIPDGVAVNVVRREFLEKLYKAYWLMRNCGA